MKLNLQLLGKDIREKRLECGKSQNEIAIIAEIERSQLSKIEQGLIPGVTFTTIFKIYKSLGYNLVPSKSSSSLCPMHPFVKWAGGKTQLLDTIVKYIPKNFNSYYEPFTGGGALLFRLQPSNFHINDLNQELICAYNCFTNQTAYEKLIAELDLHETNHNEDYYYQIRALDKSENYKELEIWQRASRMIYLNKSCFNGLYRVNSKGYFNVPSGKKSKVKCYDEENFENIRNFFANSTYEITSLDFEDAVSKAKKNDFVYFDPPYDTWEDKDSFTSYNESSFGKDEQVRLSNVFKALAKKGVYVMLSNHNTPFINELYKDFNIHVIQAKRMINCKSTGRGNVEEVLITNYE